MVGTNHRSKKIWCVDVTILFTAIQKEFMVYIVEHRVTVRTVKALFHVKHAMFLPY
jgi:hypothetical protein